VLNSEYKFKKIAVVVHVLQTTQNSPISIYQNSAQNNRP